MKTQILKAFKNDNFLSLSSNISVAAFGLLSFILIVRTLKPELFGEWAIYIAAGNFFEMLRFGVTRTAIIRFLSGAKGKERTQLIASNWYISLIATIILSLIIWLAYLIFKTPISRSGYSLFFIWYPILSFLNLPFNNALSVLMADQRFDRILIVRLLISSPFVFFLLINMFFLHLGIMPILYAHLLFHLLTSLFCMIKGWDGYKHIFKATKESNRTILNFGKYSTGTLIGVNLLKSSDVILLGISPFVGTLGVAMYSVPLKLTEILEILARSFAATAYPKMSKASIANNLKEVRKIFYSYSGGLTFIILPIVIVAFIFAEEFIWILGGPEYLATKNIFRIFCIYGLFLSIDKFSGITLDSINRPKKNFLKVVYMAAANILGDIFVIFYFAKFLILSSIILFALNPNFNLLNIFPADFQFSMLTILEMVSVVTILFTLIGILIGYYFLNKEIKIQLRLVFIEGWKFFIIILSDVVGVFRKQKSL